MNNMDFKEGVAFAIILSVLGALASTNLDLTPNQRILSWLTFVVMAGASINIIDVTFKKRFLAILFPSLSFVTSLLFIFAINYFQGINLIGSAGVIDFNHIESTTGLSLISFVLSFHIVVFLLTTIGLIVSIMSGSVIKKIIRTLLNLEPKYIGKKEKVFNSILRILLTLIAIFSVLG